ncbi:MAG: hypothetical protein AAF467_01355 [Actinomycetota bacterium]
MRALWAPKAGSTDVEWEDGFAYDEAGQRAAIADGASSAIGAGEWARVLTAGWLREPFPLGEPAAFERWLRRRQPEWQGPVGGDGEASSWWADAVANRGSWATLGLVSLTGSGRDWMLEAAVVGDICVFLVRDGVLVDACPPPDSIEFGSHPELVGTDTRSIERTVGAMRVDRFPAADGDVILAATDALAEWALGHHDQHRDLWATLATVDQASLCELARDERAAGRLVNDDVTLLRCELRAR